MPGKEAQKSVEVDVKNTGRHKKTEGHFRNTEEKQEIEQ